MDDILKSFVGKLHKRSSTDHATDAIHHLLPILSAPNRVTPEVEEEAMTALAEALKYATVHDLPVPRIEVADVLVRRVGTTPAVVDLLFDFGEDVALHLATRPEAIPDVVGVLRTDRRIWSFVELLTPYLGVETELCLALLAVLMPVATSSAALDDVNDSAHSFEVLLRLVRCEATAERFRAGGGDFLVEAVAAHRVNHRLHRSVVLRGVSHGLAVAPLTFGLFLAGCRQDVLDTIVTEVYYESVACTHGLLEGDSTARAMFLRDSPFVVALVARLSADFLVATSSVRCGLVRHLMRKEVTTTISRSTLDSLWTQAMTVDDVETIVHVGCLVASACSPRIAHYFPVLHDVLHGRWGKPRDASCEIHQEMLTRLDVLLHRAVLQMQADPSELLGLTVHGSCPDVLYHCIDRLLENSLPTSATLVGRHILDYLTTQVVAHDSSGGTPGMRRYAHDVDRKFGLQAFTPSERAERETPRWCATCPITLDAMHCPVTLSDGNTYELSSIAQHLAKSHGTRSPITRELVRPWVVYNRQMVRMEAERFLEEER